MKQTKTYKSTKYKTFKTAFVQLLERDFSLIGSGKVLELLTEEVKRLIELYYPERISPGETIISAISKDAPKGHQRGVKSLPLVPVKLDVISEDLINRYSEGEKVRQIKKDYVVNAFKQAYDQGGVLSCADVALLVKMSSATVSKYVRDHMETNDEIIPTRGFIHDVGPSISHKGIIVGKFLQGVLPDKISRVTNHSQKAVDRYINDYERVKLCLKEKMDVTIASRTTGLSKRLVRKYEELYQKYEGGNHAS